MEGNLHPLASCQALASDSKVQEGSPTPPTSGTATHSNTKMAGMMPVSDRDKAADQSKFTSELEDALHIHDMEKSIAEVRVSTVQLKSCAHFGACWTNTISLGLTALPSLTLRDTVRRAVQEGFGDRGPL